MKRQIGSTLALYPTPLVVFGAMINGKPNWLLASHIGNIGHDRVMVSLAKPCYNNQGIKASRALSINIVGEALPPKADYTGCVSGSQRDKSEAFSYKIGEACAPLIDVPLTEEQVPRLDSILFTHCGNDHYSRTTCKALSTVVSSFRAARYAASLLESELKVAGKGHDIGEMFSIGHVHVRLTPAWHNWQNESPKHHTREFAGEDSCGFWLDTPDGSVWAVGDSRLQEEQLHMPAPDVILFDFSDSRWHIGLDGAVTLANAYPKTPLILWHWGSLDAPEWKKFNGNPEELRGRVANPGRVVVLDPGEAYRLTRLEDNRV